MDSLPAGTVTFLFTDIEGSTSLWEQYPEQARAALARHDAIVEQTVGEHHGAVVRPRGEGDSRFAVFSYATDSVAAAVALQQALQGEPWPTPTPLRVRIALHTGEADLRQGDYYGSAVNRCARLRSAGHGGQTLLSLSTTELVRDALPEGAQLLDLGEHRLKDLTRPEHIYQLAAPGLPSEFPPLQTLDNRPNNLPLQPTPLVGREHELAEVGALLRRDDVRLVTLTGPGGTGKTRLGLQAAAEALDDYPHGVWLVELATLAEPRLVVPTIAAALGVKEEGSTPLIDTLKGYFKGRGMLLVLDNFEQVAGAAPDVAGLLAACPRLKVLVTSRTLLHLQGERHFPVPPLALPDLDSLPPPEELARYDAVRLFVERATALKPDFQLTGDNARVIAEICQRLDGLPLAIELAAARIRILTPQALLSRLASGLALLTGGSRDLPARQQTLRGTIAWSYDLLEEEEKTLFRRLGVFVGGATLEDIEAVCGPAPMHPEPDAGQKGPALLEVDTLDATASLVDKSLLRAEAGPGAWDERPRPVERSEMAGEPRFEMLETIREYAVEKLEEAGEGEMVRTRHAQHFLEMAEEADPQLFGPTQASWLDRLEKQHDNFRAALSWLVGPAGEGAIEEGALRICAALWRFWWAHGHLSEGRRWIELALATGSGSGRLPPTSRARAGALNAAGGLAYTQSDFGAARLFHERSLAMRRELGDKADIAKSLSNLAIVVQAQGDYSAAGSLLQESLALARELGDKASIATALNNLGVSSNMEEDYASARSYFTEALELQEEAGNKKAVAAALNNLAITAQYLKDYPTARSLTEESLALKRELGDKPAIASALSNLGNISLLEGDYDRARALSRESLALWVELGDRWGIVESLEVLAEVNVKLGHFDGAARMYGASAAEREAIGAPLSPAERSHQDEAVARGRSQLGDEAWQNAWDEGRSLGTEQAVRSALEENGPEPAPTVPPAR